MSKTHDYNTAEGPAKASLFQNTQSHESSDAYDLSNPCRVRAKILRA